MKQGPSQYLQGVIAVMTAGQGGSGDLADPDSLAQRREQSNAEQPPVDASARIIATEIAGCAAEWVIAPEADENTRVLMIHGGGFVMCGLNSHRNTAIMLSRYAACAVLVIDYRLAPETRFPGALDDCYAAWCHMREQGPSGPGSADNALVMGDSAGGNLAAALLLRLRNAGEPMADGAILMSAVLDLSCSGNSWFGNNDSDVMLGNPSLDPNGPLPESDRSWIKTYLGDADPEQPLASPLAAELGGLPPLLIMASAEERLLDDSVRFHDKAISAGVISRLEVWPHVYHAWTSVNVEVPEADLALQRMGEFVKREAYKKVAAERFAEFVDLADAMAENARRWPQHPAVIEGDIRLSWAEFDQRLNVMANALIASGVKPNDKVAALARNSLEYMVVMFGTLRAGACIVPLSGMASSESLALMMENSDARVLFVEECYRDLIEPVRAQLTGVTDDCLISLDFSAPQWRDYSDFIDGHESSDPGVSIAPDYGFNIIYSSGTTGVPKGILHARRMRFMEYPAGASTGYSPWARTLVSTPLYSNTTMASLLPTMGNGGCAVLMPKFEAEGFMALVEQHQVTHAMLVPVQYQRLFDCPDFHRYDLSSCLMKYSTSAPLREDLKRRIITEWAGGLIEFYGMTEGGVGCILLAHMFPHKLHTVGFPIPGNQLKIIGEDGQELPAGEAGEIYGRSRNMMDGYYKASAKTEESSWYDEQGNRWQRSGDMGRLDADGFLELLDRKKDMIISGGFNVFAADLEEVLIKHEQVNDVAVIAVPSPEWGETPLAIVEPAPGSQPDPQVLQAWANQRLGKVQRIAAVVLMDELPRSTIGKVLKRALREPYWQGEKKIS